MEENMDASFDEFFGAYEGENGNQTDPAAETPEPETTEEPTDDTTEKTGPDSEDGTEDGDPSGDEHTSTPGETGADGDGKPGGGDANADQTFTLKVNKEERKVTLEEMTAFAQKGADYDRVKDQNTQLRQTNADLQTKLDGMAAQQGVLDILGVIANKSGSTLEQLADTLYINFRKSAGVSEDAAREELKSSKLEKELDTYKARQTQQTQQQAQENDAAARAQRDMEEFRQNFPDVQLTEDLVDKLVPDVQKGMSLTSAYLKMENARLKAEAEAQRQREAAEAQNKKNRTKTPGSQQDSGGRRTKDAADDFFAAFEK